MAKRLTATLQYSVDAYALVDKQENINGRRLAGSSFIRGFLKHASADDINLLGMGKASLDPVVEMVAETAPGKRGVAFGPHQLDKLGARSVIHRADPDMAVLSYQRLHYRQDAFSICGVTHTTAGYRLPDPFLNLRQCPTEPWDGLICTATTVIQSLEYRLDAVDDMLTRRFGATPPRPQMTVIPLGINVDEFEVTPKDRSDLRAEIGAAEDDVVVMTLARLSPQFKFDPLPLFLAAEQAQARCGGRIHLLFSGYFLGGYAEGVFRKSAAALAPNVKVHFRPANSGDQRRQALAGGDIFVFPIDNIQETFGLAPIEAMAAGMPVIVSDWNGMKDTVSEDVGFRIPTRTVRGELSRNEAFLNQVGYDDMNAHMTLMSAMAEIDVGAFADKIAVLANDPDLRRRMGAAGRKRAASVYDWGVIIPQYEEFWAELDDRRRSAAEADATRYVGAASPVAPPPLEFFSMYPTSQGLATDLRIRLGDGATPERVALVRDLRNYTPIGRTPLNEDAANAVITALGGGAMTVGALATATDTPPDILEKTLIWLLKYDLVRSGDAAAPDG